MLEPQEGFSEIAGDFIRRVSESPSVDPRRIARILAEFQELHPEHYGRLEDLAKVFLSGHASGNNSSRSNDEGGSKNADLPQRIGRCLILAKIGEGGGGVVYRARHLELDRIVAVKTRFPDPEGARQFKHEAVAAAQIHHTNIVPIYEFNVDENAGLEYYVMPLIDGSNLLRVVQEVSPSRGLGSTATPAPPICSTLLDRFRCPELRIPEVLRIGLALAEAVEFVHKQGLSHRDIKPSNLIVENSIDADGRVWLTDFGMARIRDRALPEAAPRSQFISTPKYVPPESLQPARFPEISGVPQEQLDVLHDVYSLGVTLYELATLRAPFVGDLHVNLKQRILEAKPVPPRSLTPTLSRDFEAIILKAMAEDPSRRYQSAEELCLDIRRHSERRSVGARPVGPATQAVMFCRRHPRETIYAGVFVVLTAVGVNFALALDAKARNQRRINLEGLRSVASLIEVARGARFQDEAPWREVARAIEGLAPQIDRGEEELADELEARRLELDAGLRDVRFARELLGVLNSLYTTNDQAESLARFTRVFRDFGLDPADPSTASRIAELRERSPGLAVVVGAALDKCSFFGRSTATPPAQADLFDALARVVDPDPVRIRLQNARAVATDRESARAALLAIAKDAEAERPLFPSTAVALAESLAGYDAGEAAESLLRNARLGRFDDPWINQSLGTLLLRKEDPDSRTEGLRILTQAATAQRELGFDLASALESVGRPEEALALWRQLARLLPDDPQIRGSLGLCLRLQGKVAEAESELAAAEQRLVRLRNARPLDRFERNSLGVVFARTRRPHLAIAEFRAAGEIPAALSNLSAILVDVGKPEEALPPARRAVELAPADPVFRDTLAVAFQKTRKLDDAAVQHRAAIRLADNCFQFHVNYSNTLLEMKRVDDALNEARTAVRLSPNSPQARHALGVVHRERGEFDLEIEEFRNAASLPSKEGLFQSDLGRALVDRALRRSDYRELLEGLKNCTEATRLEPDSGDFHTNHGRALLAIGDKRGAFAALEKSVRLSPTTFEGHFNLGVASLELRRHALAESSLRKALELRPDSHRAAIALGKVLQARGRLKEGLALMEATLKQIQAGDPGQAIYEQSLEQAAQFVALESRLAMVLAGKAAPASFDESLKLAQLCRLRGWLYDAVNLYVSALGTMPIEQDAPDLGLRYQAAACAVLAADGEDVRPVAISAAERARLRGYALDLLELDLNQWKQLTPIVPKIALDRISMAFTFRAHDSDFASVRENSALAELDPLARLEWTVFWGDLARTRELAAGSK